MGKIIMNIKKLSDSYKDWWKSKPQLPEIKFGSGGIARISDDGNGKLFLQVKNSENDGTIHELNMKISKARELYIFLKQYFD